MRQKDIFNGRIFSTLFWKLEFFFSGRWDEVVRFVVFGYDELRMGMSWMGGRDNTRLVGMYHDKLMRYD